ncbi:MAG TPA: hypothetical protein VF862_13660 [Gemmatimonadales bacterium]
MPCRARLLLAAATLVLISACAKEDTRLKSLGVGISKDSAFIVMELPAEERGEAYLIDGQYIEAFVVRKPGVQGPRDSLTREQATPVVVIGGQVTGWGWDHWDSVAGAHNIEVKPAKK